MMPSAKWVPAAVGFFLGAMFIFLLDKYMPHLHINFDDQEKEGMKTQFRKTTLLILAITLHNIPEGLAVGVLFGAAANGMSEATIPGAIALAIGIGIQNFPEGLAVAVPLRRLGVSRLKSFWYGQLVGNRRAHCRRDRRLCGDLYGTCSPLCTGLCCGCHDLCCSGRSYTGNTAG